MRYDYAVEKDWPKIPEEMEIRDVCGLAADSDGSLYVLNRGKNALVKLDREGNVTQTWAESFGRAHGIAISPDGFIWCVDDNAHSVMKFSRDGELLLTVGDPGKPSDTGCENKNYLTVKRAAGPFCYPTKIAFCHKTSDFFVCDGYGNAAIHRFTAEGEHLYSFGAPGTDKKQFRIPHSIAIDEDDNIFLADRENDRIQVFSDMGKLLDIWEDCVYRPQDVAIDARGNVFVIEMGYKLQNTVRRPVAVPPWARVSIFTHDGKLIQRIGEENGFQPGSIQCPHAIALGPEGEMYTGEVVLTLCKGAFPEGAHPLQKFILKGIS